MRDLLDLVLILLILGSIYVYGDDTSTNEEVNLSSDQIAKLRNFQAENHYVTTADGYIINVVRIPAVRGTNKRPVIFNHGTTQSSTYFMTNSVGARPKDFAGLNAASMSQSNLERLLINEPVAKSFPLLLSCFGHEVWLINRRGTEFSLGKVNLDSIRAETATFAWQNQTDSSPIEGRQNNPTRLMPSVVGLLDVLTKPQINLGSIANTLDAGYWNFSLDEQARYDVPAVITYVLNRTQSEKVAYVGHSLGNGVMFMLLAEQPLWADKVEPFLAWSPDFYLGHTTSILAPLLITLQPVLSELSIPFPPTPIDPLTRTLLALLCQTKIAQETICLLLEQLMFGFSGLQQETLPAFVASQFYSVSSHEAAQLAQNVEKGKMHHYDYGSAAANERAYGQPSPPIYDVGRITSRSISLWRGLKDNLASPTDVELLKADFRVPIDDRIIDQVPFNHYDLLFGRNVTNLVNIPSLKLLESYGQ